jgi:hypothetical protein
MGYLVPGTPEPGRTKWRNSSATQQAYPGLLGRFSAVTQLLYVWQRPGLLSKLPSEPLAWPSVTSRMYIGRHEKNGSPVDAEAAWIQPVEVGAPPVPCSQSR